MNIGPGNELRCNVPGCNEEIHLLHTGAVPLYGVNPPWPGAGDADYSPAGAVASWWEVKCLADHVLWNSVDQIRAMNAALPEDSEDYLDETGEDAPPFDLDLFPGAWS